MAEPVPANREWPTLAKRIKTLMRLDHEPVAIAFGVAEPAGVPQHSSRPPAPVGEGRTGAVPAGCCFWAEAEGGAFSTTAEDHANCSVGSYTHGFVDLATAAGCDDTAALVASGWVTPADLAAAPAVSGDSSYINYGPLVSAAFEPDVILLRLTPSALMTLQGAWPELELAGKPQCQIVPLAVEGAVVASLGCAVSRARTGMSAEEVTCALPAHTLAPLMDRMERTAAADTAVAAFAATDRERFDAA